MKSTLEKLEGLGRKLTINIPAEKVKEAFNEVYVKIQRNANIKGFRKGKAPLSAVRNMYADKVRQDVLQNLVSENYPTALEEHSLEPISQPHIHIHTFEEGIDFEFCAELEVRPDVKLKNYEGLTVEKEIFELSEAKVDEIINNIRNSFQETSPIFEDRPAQTGDIANISFDGYVDGDELPGGKSDDHNLELGSNSFIPGFEDGVLGMTIGSSKELKLNFPKDYHAKDIAGKEVSFKVTLKKLLKKSLPEVNDDLAKKVGEHFKSLEDLKNAIRDDIKKNEERRINEDLKNNVLQSLVKANPVEVPNNLKTEQEKRLVADTSQRLQQQGMDQAGVAEYLKKWDEDFEKQAAMMIQSSFLIDALAKELKLKASEEDVEKRLETQAKELGLELVRLKEYYDKPEQRSNLKYQITEDKAIEHLLSKAKIKEVKRKEERA